MPKSASVLYAVSDDPWIQGAVIDAGEHAVREAVGWLQRHAIEVQRGSHNTAWIDRKRAELVAAGEDPSTVGPRRLKTSGVVGAAFRHRTSRAGDPLLHWHVLIANLVEGADGKWAAFAHPDLYRHARAAGEVFQAAFRAELTRTLGVEWRPGRHVPEIAGIPQSLLDVFSKRRAEIEAWLEATGGPTDAAGQQEAVLATRRGKLEREGERVGRRLEGRSRQRPAGARSRRRRWRPGGGPAIRWASTRCGVSARSGSTRTVERSTTSRSSPRRNGRRTAAQGPHGRVDDVHRRRRRPRRSPGGSATGATVTTIERITSLVLADPTGDGGRQRRRPPVVHQPGAARRRGTLRRRRHRGPRPGHRSTRPPSRQQSRRGPRSAPTRPRRSVGSAPPTAPLSVLIGPAGTGKTYTLDTIRDAYERAGWRVIGAGPSARAAQELTAGAGIPARTMHALLADVDRGLEQFDARTLLVVDEAGMADIRTLELVTTAAAAPGRPGAARR